MAIEITFVKVQAGDGLIAIAGRVAPPGITAAQKQSFAQAIAITNGITLTTQLYVGRILMIDSTTIPVPPVTIPPTSYNTTVPYNDATKVYNAV